MYICIYTYSYVSRVFGHFLHESDRCQFPWDFTWFHQDQRLTPAPRRRDAVPGGVRAMAAKLAKELGAKANLQDMGMDGSGASENTIVYWWLYVQPVKWNPIN